MDSRYTVGVEEEYQLVDPDSGDLRSCASRVLDADWSEEIRKEMQETMLEVGTPVCAGAEALERELRRMRFQVASTAAAEDLAIVAAGLHPFSVWSRQKMMPDARYQRLRERFGRVALTEHVFGMHIHVAVPEGVDRIRLINVARNYLPHLLALSASSPFYEGHDTGYASYRTILAGRLPHSGIPPRFRDEAHFQGFVRQMLDARVLEDEGSLYWNLRPHLRYPTIEFRVTDVCPRLEDAVAIAALARAIVIAAAEGELPEPQRAHDDPAWDAALAANQWQAARYGLDAVILAPLHDGRGARMRQALGELVERVRPVAREMGDGEAFDRIGAILETGNAATRMRETLARQGDHASLVRWLSDESLLGTGMDRRRESRDVLV